MKTWIFRLAILMVAFSFPVVAWADDLDTFLALPPSASLTPNDAAHRIEVLRALIPSHPDREAEIEAYLIPFVRATQPPPATPTPTPTPVPAKAKPLLLLKNPDGTATTMKAISYRRQGAVIIVVADNGSHAVLQTLTLQGELPWYSAKELESGAVDLGGLAGRYETFAQAMPALRKPLNAESTRLRKMQKAKDDAASAKRNAVQARLKEVTAAVYEPDSGYTRTALAEMLLKAEKVRTELPETAGRIDEWGAPFREHFMKLLAGNSFMNGAWVSDKELARKALEKRQAAFLNGLDYQIGTAPFPSGAAEGLVTMPMVGAGLAIVAGLALAIFGRRRPYLLITGVALLAATPIAISSLFFLATRNPALLPSAIPLGDEQSIVEALSQAAGLGESIAESRKISGDALNGFLSRHVRLAPASGEVERPDVRQAVAVRLLPGRIAVFEMISSMGLNWMVRMDLGVRQVDGKPSIVLAGATIGALDCPEGFAAGLWKNLEPQFAAILSASRIAERFSVESPGDGFVELKPLPNAAAGSADAATAP